MKAKGESLVDCPADPSNLESDGKPETEAA